MKRALFFGRDARPRDSRFIRAEDAPAFTTMLFHDEKPDCPTGGSAVDQAVATVEGRSPPLLTNLRKRLKDVIDRAGCKIPAAGKSPPRRTRMEADAAGRARGRGCQDYSSAPRNSRRTVRVVSSTQSRQFVKNRLGVRFAGLEAHSVMKPEQWAAGER